MVKRIKGKMIEGLHEVGDLMHSARSAKSLWLKCEGQAVSRSVYSALFGEIGTAFGAGDGSTTFNIPDARGRALIGVGSGTGLTARVLGSSGGAETHILTEAQMPAHYHTAYNASTGGGGSQITVPTSGGNMVSDNRTATAGSGAAHNNMQPWLAAGSLFLFAGV